MLQASSQKITKTKPQNILMVDFDNTLINIHLTTLLKDYNEKQEHPILRNSLTVYDYKTTLNIEDIPLIDYANKLRSDNEFSFNPNVLSKVLNIFNEPNQKLAIVTNCMFPSVVYELIVNELKSFHKITDDQLRDKFKVVGGEAWEYSGKTGHILKALLAFDSININDINQNNLLDCFKDITLIDDDERNIKSAIDFSLRAILVKDDNLHEIHKNNIIVSHENLYLNELWYILHPEDKPENPPTPEGTYNSLPNNILSDYSSQNLGETSDSSISHLM